MQTAHAINFADCPDGARYCQGEIVAFVRGVRRPRQNPVGSREIKKWLCHTPDDFIDEQISALCAKGRIRCLAKTLKSHRRANGAYVYEAAE